MLQIDNSKYEDYIGQFDYQIKLQNLVKIFHQKIERQTKTESKYYPKFFSLYYIKPYLIQKKLVKYLMNGHLQRKILRLLAQG